MKTLGRFEFPETGEEALAWNDEQLLVRGLHTYVIAVAKLRIEGAWRCYIVPCPGYGSHRQAAVDLWQNHGTPVDEESLARALFPQLEDIPYAY